MSTTKAGTIEIWFNSTTKTIEAIIKETTNIIVAIPCALWTSKEDIAYIVEREACRKTK